MIDTSLRKYAQKSFDTLAKVTGLTKLHPITITVLGFILGVACALSLYFGNVIVAIVLLWTSGVFDVLDGTVARLTNKSSKVGAFLDLVFDRLVEVLIIFGFYFLKPEFVITYFIFYMGMIFNFSTFMVAGALFKNQGNKSMHYDGGLVERTESFIFFSLMMLFPSHIFITLNLFNALMILTAVFRTARIVVYETKR